MNVKKNCLEHFGANFGERSGGSNFTVDDRIVDQKIGNNNLWTIYPDHFPIGFF